MACEYIEAVFAQAHQSEPGHSLVLRGGELRADRAFWESIPERTGPRGAVKFMGGLAHCNVAVGECP